MEPSQTDLIELRLPLGRWIGGYFFGVLMVALGLGLAAFALVEAPEMAWQFGVMLALLCGFTLAMAAYTLRDARAKQGLSIRAGAESLELRLPAARSLVRTLSAERRSLPWSEIAAIETRLEAYRSLGMANMQRAYVLRLRSGEPLFLGEDRALGTNLETSMLAELVARLCARATIELIDRGMAEGRGGLLALVFTAVPPWSAENLDARRQASLWRAALRPAVVMLIAPLLVLLLSLLSR